MYRSAYGIMGACGSAVAAADTGSSVGVETHPTRPVQEILRRFTSRDDAEEAIELVKRTPNIFPNGKAEVEIRKLMDIEDFGDGFTPSPEIAESEVQVDTSPRRAPQRIGSGKRSRRENDRKESGEPCQFAGPIEPRQFARVVLVVFPLHAGPLRNERRRDHLARMAPLVERALEHVARPARLITHAKFAVARGAVAGNAASVIDSLCTSIPTSMIERTVVNCNDMGWSPGGDRTVVACGSGNSGSHRGANPRVNRGPAQSYFLGGVRRRMLRELTSL